MPSRKPAASKPRKAAATRPPRRAARAAAGAKKAAGPAAPHGKSPAGAGQTPETIPAPPAAEHRATARKARPAAARTITIVQIRSGIQAPFRHKRILRSLGLRHPHHRVVRPDNPAVRGMVEAIPHLAQIVEAADGA